MKLGYITSKTYLPRKHYLTIFQIYGILTGNRTTAILAFKLEYNNEIDRYDYIIKDLSEVLNKSRLNEMTLNKYLLKLIMCKLEYLISCITYNSDLLGCELICILRQAHNDITLIFNDLDNSS